MDVLVIEDSDDKFGDIEGVLMECLMDRSVTIQRVVSLAEATRKIHSETFELIIIDLMIPRRTGDTAVDVSEEILEEILLSEDNVNARSIAITGFSDIMDVRFRGFNENNIAIVEYGNDGSFWKEALRREIQFISRASHFDFAIFCALEKERSAFNYSDLKIGERRNLFGLDSVVVEVGTRKGIIVKPARVGMVDTAVSVSRALELFRPSVVAMSGICAGIPENAQVGDLIVVENCFDYEVGKWTGDGFKTEIYPIEISEEVRLNLIEALTPDSVNAEVRSGLNSKKPEALFGSSVKFSLNASGSAVVADEERRKKICDQHRKLTSVEMEIYGLYRSASLSPYKPKFFAVKCVVDDAGPAKDDSYHEYGAAASARLVVVGLKSLLAVT